MPANNDAIFSRVGDLSANGSTGMGAVVTAAANDFTGAGANNVLVFTADATNGGFIRSIRCKAAGTNVASAVRVFLNTSAGANTTASNNVMLTELGLPATTASATAQTSNDLEIPLFLALNPGFRIYCGLATAVAAGWFFVPIAGKY